MNFTEFREQKRADRAAERQADREDRLAERQADRDERNERREQKQADRAARVATVKSWVSWVCEHPIDLLMAVIVVVPALLAWTAMAAYGIEVYGGIGALFPLFSEAGMWAFAFAAQMNRRKNKPVWRLMIGLWLFAAVAAFLNYLHGSEVSVRVGLVMAVVSVSGVIAHQIHMGADRPRPTREQKRQDARERLAARRSHRMEMAATRQASGELSEDGTVRLMVQPGTVTLKRSRVRPWRHTVSYDPVPGVGADGPGTVPASVADEVEQWLATGPEPPVPGDGNTPVPAEGDTTDDLQKERVGNTVPAADRNTPARGRSWDDLVTAFWGEIEAGTVNPTSQRNVREVMGCSRDRAKRLVELYRSTGPDGGAVATR